MDIKNIVTKVLREAVSKNFQKHFNSIYPNWNQNFKELFKSENDLPIKDAEQIYNIYRSILGNLKMDNETVVQFLNKHDGRRKRRKLELNDLQNFERLTFKEVLELLGEFSKFDSNLLKGGVDIEDAAKKEEEERLIRLFADNGVLPTDEKIEESRKMWYNTETAKIKEGSIRVYEILNQKEAIRMGYYYQRLHSIETTKNEKNRGSVNQKFMFGNSKPWCVTMRGPEIRYYRTKENGETYGAANGAQGSNLYSHYRSNGFTFYFIIDDSKPVGHPYHISSLAATKSGFKHTSFYNDGDVQKSWEEVIKIYPELKNHQDKIVSREKDTEESEKSIVDIVNENEGDENEFAVQPIAIQMDFVNNGGLLKKPYSWQQANKTVRKQYINTTNTGNRNIKFSNLEFILEVISRPPDKNALNSKLKRIGIERGFVDLVEYVFKDDGIVIYRNNLLNPEISLYRNKNTNQYGLFDMQNIKWYQKDGVSYDGNLNLNVKHKKVYFDSSDQSKYISECFTKGDTIDDNTLFTMLPLDKINNKTAGAYFFTNKKFEEMLSSGAIKDLTNPVSNITNVAKQLNKDSDFKQDVDIKEMGV